MQVHTRMLVLLNAVLLFMLHSGQSELFTAIVNLEQVLHAERGIAQDLRNYIAKEEDRIAQLKKLADDFEQHSEEALKDPETHLSNPVNSFLLIKRFTADWDRVVQDLVRGNSSDEFFSDISSKLELFPCSDDLTGAAVALLRLQDTYALPSEKIARGELLGVQNSARLSANDCYELGRIAYNNEDYYHCVLWMVESLENLKHEEPPTTDKALLLDYLAFATYRQGNLHHALNLTLAWLIEEPDHVRAQNNKKYYEQMIAEEEAERHRKGDDGPAPAFTNARPKDDYKSSEEFDAYERLCRGETTHKYKYAHKLSCRYKSHHPLFYIQPLKEEVMYLKPWIAVYHNLMSDNEIAKVKELAQPRLHRSGVFQLKEQDSIYTNFRTSQSAWLGDELDPVIRRHSLRTALMSNLSLETVETLQVLNYGIAGHYAPHWDFSRDTEINAFDNSQGNRIATVICYMSDVVAGGGTVFPTLGVKMFPEAGACVVWYNLKRNGQGDFATLHAGCPVLIGNKWVCNKWYHERGQEVYRPCSLNPDE